MHSNYFAIRRVIVHLLILSGAFFAIALYILMFVQKASFCMGYIAFHRLQFVCIFSALAILLR